MDVFVDYARSIGKPTAKLTFWDLLKMITWAERRFNKIFSPHKVKKISDSNFLKKGGE